MKLLIWSTVEGISSSYFNKASEGHTVNGKNFWRSVSSFLTNKKVRKADFITLQDGKNTKNEFYVTQTFNKPYINIVETTCGVFPKILGPNNNLEKDSESVQSIIHHYKDHPNIKNINRACNYSLFLKLKR